MDLDDEICLCFRVTKRKVVNFIRVEKVRRVGQLSECFGAGTGCGWCRPFLERLFDQAAAEGGADREEPSSNAQNVSPQGGWQGCEDVVSGRLLRGD
jgi:NAD(P)H-nitrite reductase large subunit